MHTCSCDKQNRQNGITSKQKALYKDSLTQSTCWRSMSVESARSTPQSTDMKQMENWFVHELICALIWFVIHSSFASHFMENCVDWVKTAHTNRTEWTNDRSTANGNRNDGSIHWERHMQRQWKWLPNENGRTDTLCLIDCMLCVLSRIDKVGTMFVVRLCDNQTNIVCRRWRWLFNSNSIFQTLYSRYSQSTDTQRQRGTILRGSVNALKKIR